jgi:uncharacterized membrane protein
MTLLFPLGLLFGLTALVPLLLHLYQRRRRAVIEFSTNRFFTASIIRSQRRLRLRRWLLLLLRMGICVLLALALARPVSDWLSLAQAGRRDLVILLDDSLSMQAGAPTQTRFDQARRIAADVLNGLTAGDRAAVVTFTGRMLGQRGAPPSDSDAQAGGPAPSATPGVQNSNVAGALFMQSSRFALSDDFLGLADQVQQLAPTSAAGDAHAALRRAADLLAPSGSRQPRVVILSDFQESDWRTSPWPQPPQPIAVTALRLDPPTANNVAVDQVTLAAGTAVAGQPNLLRVRLANYAAGTRRVDMVVSIDEQEAVRRPVALAGGGPHVERVPLVFAEPGEHRLRVTIDAPDDLPVDNTLFATIGVSPQLAVLLVDGGGGPARQSAAFYIRTALHAASGGSDPSAAGRVDVVVPADLPAVVLDGYRVVLLCDVRDLPLPQVERLEQYVQAGGGLAVFLGSEADRDFYNGLLGGSAGNGSLARPLGGLLPAELHDLLDTRGGDRPLHVVSADLEHPVLQRFKDGLHAALAGLNVYRAWAVVPREAWVVATLDRELPWIVERGYGRGRVMLFTSLPDPSWSNLPLRRVFLPLVNRLVSYLAGGGAGAAESSVGEEMVLLRGGWDLYQPVYVARPDGGRQRATIALVGTEPVALLPGSAVDQPGFYRVELPIGTRSASQRPARARSPSDGPDPDHCPPLLRAVNAPRTESIPHLLDLGRAQAQAGSWRLTTVAPAAANDTDSLAALWSTGRGGRGLWDTLLWVVLMLALLEPLVARVASAPRGQRKSRAGIPAVVGTRKGSRTREERAA